MHTFHPIKENETYLGDMVDFNGRRIALIIHQGVAVFAQCPTEKHYLFKEDFEALAATLDFVYAAGINNGVFHWDEQLEHFFDNETLERIHQHLLLSLGEEG